VEGYGSRAVTTLVVGNASGFGAKVVLVVMRECAVADLGGDSFSFNTLLPYADGCLGDVNEGGFRASDDHLFDVVVLLWKLSSSRSAGRALEGLADGHLFNRSW
jgi:hypothetical protein